MARSRDDGWRESLAAARRASLGFVQARSSLDRLARIRIGIAQYYLDDLAQAGEVIDLLMLLRERTEGHRTAQETRVLEDLLYDLQLRYVEVKRQSG